MPVTVVMFVTLMTAQVMVHTTNPLPAPPSPTHPVHTRPPLHVQNIFSKTSMALKDLEARTRSPLLSQLEECLDGITTLRCFRAHHTMLDIFGHGLNINAEILFLSFACRLCCTAGLDCAARAACFPLPLWG